MQNNNIAVFCALLLLSGGAFAEDLDMTVAPVAPQSSAEVEAKTPEFELTPLENLDFRTEEERERVYNKKDNTPFSGALQKKDDEGLVTTFFYRNGYKNGVATAYAEDGHLEIETTYRKGYKDGEEISFFENGKPRLKQTFSQNELNGEEIVFYNNGKPERVNHYLNGKLDGETTYLDRDGNIVKKEHYKDGKKNGVEHIISDNMLKEENNYVNDALDGITKKFDKQFLIEEISYKNGKRNGISKRFLENGSWSEVEYKDDVINGTSRSFYPDKTVAEIVNYTDNQRNGLAEKFSPKAVRLSSENYKNGKLEGISRKFNENGDLASVAYYVNGIEMAIINIDENTDLRDIYALIKQNSLNKVISNKNLWYPILWLGLNLEKIDVINSLESEMKMYAADISNFEIFKRESKSKFEDYNRKLFFGLTPLGYAVNITAPTAILQKFVAPADNINMQNPRGTTALLEAVRLNNLQMVKYLLANQADVSATYAGGNTILLYALKENSQNSIIEELLKAGADVNAADANGQTPLMLAVTANNADLTDILLQNNADTKQKTSTGKTILAYAFENNVEPKIFSRLIVGGADVNAAGEDGNILLIQALAAAKYDLVDQLLKNGADVNLQNQNSESALSYVLSHDVPDNILAQVVESAVEPFDDLPKYEKPLWKVLAEQKRYELLKKVITNMGGINIKDSHGETVLGYLLKNPDDQQLYDLVVSFLNEAEVKADSSLLFEAFDAGNMNFLKKLVELGADVNARNSDGKMLLDYMLDKGYTLEFVEAIANGKLDVNSANALEKAIHLNDAQLAEILIKNGATVNRPASKTEGYPDNSSYLMILKHDNDKITKLLLENGADINYSPERDKTMLMYAVKSGNPTLIAHLLENDFSVDQADADGNTAIMYIADMIGSYKQNPTDSQNINRFIKEVAQILQAKGADINTQNNNGETLLIRVAKEHKDVFADVLNTLVELGAKADKKDQYGKTAADYAK